MKRAYGVGTNLTNDVGFKPLNMVIKMFSAQVNRESGWVDTIKLSDDKGKITGNPEILQAVKYLFPKEVLK